MMFNFYNAIILIASVLLFLYVITWYFKKKQSKIDKKLEDFVVSEWIAKAIDLLDRVKPEDYLPKVARATPSKGGYLVNIEGNNYRLLFKDFAININPCVSGVVEVEVYRIKCGTTLEMRTLNMNSEIGLERDYANSAMRVINMAQDINIKEVESEKEEIKQKFLSL